MIVAGKRSTSATVCRACEITGTIPNEQQSECFKPAVNGLDGIPEERQRWTEGATYAYPVRLNFQPASSIAVHVYVEKSPNTATGAAAADDAGDDSGGGP